jgi:hypothetical protein
MATIIRVNIQDLDATFFKELGEHLTDAAQVEIRIQPEKNFLLSEEQFWTLIDALDWSQKNTFDKLNPSVLLLVGMPIANIYLFADKLAEKLYTLDTRAHGNTYLAQQEDDYLSVDDFLYNRCAIVAEGKDYFEKVVKNPLLFDSKLSFEALLSIAPQAYFKKTGRNFDYQPICNIETYSNTLGWQ